MSCKPKVRGSTFKGLGCKGLGFEGVRVLESKGLGFQVLESKGLGFEGVKGFKVKAFRAQAQRVLWRG